MDARTQLALELGGFLAVVLGVGLLAYAVGGVIVGVGSALIIAGVLAVVLGNSDRDGGA